MMIDRKRFSSKLDAFTEGTRVRFRRKRPGEKGEWRYGVVEYVWFGCEEAVAVKVGDVVVNVFPTEGLDELEVCGDDDDS